MALRLSDLQVNKVQGLGPWRVWAEPRSCFATSWLAAGVVRFALAQEGGDALGEVGGFHALVEGCAFGVHLGGEVAVEAFAEEALDAAIGPGGAGGEAFGQGGGAGSEVGGGDDEIDEAEAEGFLGVDGVGEEGDFQGFAQADEAGEVPGAAAVDAGADAGVGEGEFGVVGGDGEVGGHGDAHAGAGDWAVEAGEDGLGYFGEVG